MSNENLNQENINGENYIPAPWFVCETPKNAAWFSNKTIGAANPNDARRVCDVWSLVEVEIGSTAHANARRIVACVNACEGLETTLLESSSGTMFNTLRMIQRLGGERDQLLNFARDILAHWPDGNYLDGRDIQNIAVKHGLLIPTIVYEPCNLENPDSKSYKCREYLDSTDFEAGATCYHRAEFLKGGAQ